MGRTLTILNSPGMARKKRKKPIQQKGIYNNKMKTDTLTPPTTQPTMKIITQKKIYIYIYIYYVHNDTPQHRSPTDSNDTSTAGSTLQINKATVTKAHILDSSDSSGIPRLLRR